MFPLQVFERFVSISHPPYICATCPFHFVFRDVVTVIVFYNAYGTDWVITSKASFVYDQFVTCYSFRETGPFGRYAWTDPEISSDTFNET
jgi:hypothetical protein